MRNSSWSETYHITCQTYVMAEVCMAASRTTSLAFIVTADRRVEGCILCSDSVKCYKTRAQVVVLPFHKPRVEMFEKTQVLQITCLPTGRLIDPLITAVLSALRTQWSWEFWYLFTAQNLNLKASRWLFPDFSFLHMSHLQDFEIIKQVWILDKDSLSKYKMYLSDDL